MDVAAELGADAVSFWSGTPADAASPEELLDRLVDGCQQLCDYAETRGMRLAFEPEPGMFIDTMARYAELRERVDHPLFGLTLDIGHLHCLGEDADRATICGAGASGCGTSTSRTCAAASTTI